MIKIGVICPSEIAFRRFMPALMKCDNLCFVGIGVCSSEERFSEDCTLDISSRNRIIQQELEKANDFISQYGGKLFESYSAIIQAKEIDAIYIPLPPSLHYFWAMKALKNGKHVLLEKPSTLSLKETQELVSIARVKKLALHENYMFMYHSQIEEINKLIRDKSIGDIRLIRIYFGFPRRKQNDFRYNKNLGGGALFDAGGYVIKYAKMLLGDTAKIIDAHMSTIPEFDVDIYGSGTMINSNSEIVQFSYGMDNAYKCELEIWGSNGCLRTDRILTAPVGFSPKLYITIDGVEKIIEIPADDSFYKSIAHFIECINDVRVRERTFIELSDQMALVEDFLCQSEKGN